MLYNGAVLPLEVICKIADVSARMCTRRLSGSSRSVDSDSFRKQLVLWENIKNKKGEELSPEEIQEVYEALESQAFDDYLREYNIPLTGRKVVIHDETL